ncbi:MAG: ECF-type sigma factor [Acidobacteriota bacterium]
MVATPDSPDDITGLLDAWSAGDRDALDRLLPLVFDDLHRMARYFFQRESDTHTLQPTALVSELYFRLRGQKIVAFDSRQDFFNFAASVMRHILVDYARRRTAQRRGSGRSPVPLDAIGFTRYLATLPPNTQLLDLDRALRELEAIDARQAKIVGLRYFLGLQVPEIAELLEVSESTVKRDWRTAKLWLRHRLESGPTGDDE